MNPLATGAILAAAAAAPPPAAAAPSAAATVPPAAAAPSVAAAVPRADAAPSAAAAPPPAVHWAAPVPGAATRLFSLGPDPFARGQHRGVDLDAAPGDRVRSACA